MPELTSDYRADALEVVLEREAMLLILGLLFHAFLPLVLVGEAV